MTRHGSKYHVLADTLRHLITSGVWAPGVQIPTEAELCAHYGVSRGTVRQALQVLTQDNLLSREQGRGTFVKPAPPGVALSLISFNEAMQRQGRQPSTRLLRAQTIPAPHDIARRLKLAASTPVLRIERLRLADGAPVSHEIRWLSRSLCPSLLQEDLEINSIHELLIHKYRIPLTRMTHAVSIGSDPGPMADLLQAPPDTPLFSVERLTYTTGDRPAVFYQALFRSDQYHFVFEVQIDRA